MGGTSAYSKVTYQVCTRLAKLGYKIAHVPMGMANRMGKWSYKGVLIYPSGNDPFCEDVLLDHYVDWHSDLCITLKEPWVFRTLNKLAINFVPHAILDHSPVSPSITSRLHTAFKVICVSRFAQRELKQAGIENTFYIPHGIATVYKPLEEHRGDCKKMWFLDEDDFTVLIVSRNQSRKQIPRMLRAYKLFKERNPDVKSHLLLWTDIQPLSRQEYEGAVGLGVSDVGVNLLPEIMQLGLGEDVLWPDPKLVRGGVPEWAGPDFKGGWDIVKLFNACDVLLGTTGGEGFFLPGVEAQACGKPIVVSDYAAAPEICGAGLTVPCNDYVILNTPGTRYALADLDRTADALTKILNADREKLARKARRFALRYDWSRIMEEYWKPFLSECEEELYPLITKEGEVKTWA